MGRRKNGDGIRDGDRDEIRDRDGDGVRDGVRDRVSWGKSRNIANEG